jgi:hypothetical protein
LAQYSANLSLSAFPASFQAVFSTIPFPTLENLLTYWGSLQDDCTDDLDTPKAQITRATSTPSSLIGAGTQWLCLLDCINRGIIYLSGPGTESSTTEPSNLGTGRFHLSDIICIVLMTDLRTHFCNFASAEEVLNAVNTSGLMLKSCAMCEAARWITAANSALPY